MMFLNFIPPTGAVESTSVPLVSDPVNLSRFVSETAGFSYVIARFIMDIVDWILGIFGLEHNDTLVTILYSAVVLGVAVVIGYAVQWIVLWIVKAIARRWNSDTYYALTRQRFFHKICRIIPPLAFLTLIQFTLSNHNALLSLFTRITAIYIVVVVTISLSALVMTVWERVNARANKRKLPLSGLAQLAKGILWIIAVIIIVAIIVDKSPGRLLTGLGAFSAVIMLIFKNNILSLVAGVQLSENDSLHVGDWIQVDGTNANGTVQDVSLVAVKVLNWDKTTTTLPPYNLISSGFTNYRTMQESNTRRICRSYMIDADSVLPATPQMLDQIKQNVPLMRDFIDRKLAQRAAGNVADVDNPDGLVNGTIDTNLGLFRAYMKMWLDANPHISHDSDCFVSTLPQTPNGIPFQVYCFTATSKWFPYEAIQDSVFEHLAAMLRYFHLYTFENASGRDAIIEGYLGSKPAIDTIYGIPYPFFQSPGSPVTPAPAPAAATPPPSGPAAPQQPSSAAPAAPTVK